MQDLALFAIGHERGRWLAARVSALATNVANADTPGYQPRDVASFDAALKVAAVQMDRTEPGHLGAGGAVGGSYELVPRASGVTKHSGNSVSLESEMASLGEARSQQSAVTSILGTFHRFLLASVKG
ncbi:MAG: flagellar basal body protein [Hyphomicrobiaceae bacterium]